MEREHVPPLHPALLPPGTIVGRWRVVAWAGCGVHGAVYRVVPVDNEQARPLALKLALLPRDPRFACEAEMLSRVRHPSIPRLWEYGDWQHPSGTLHPYIVMEWVDGARLYDWAREHNPTSGQVLKLFAQLARALQALHSQGSVHRDVKGDNVLVRRADTRALLTDFGSGHYLDAPTLTPEILPPGTPAYRSPEAWLFSLQFSRDPAARYAAGPADDLYSLGVTAYRLVTGEYPELAEPRKDEAGTWHLEGIASASPLVLAPRVDPRLRALILRMLSERPEDRGTAVELAKALEQAAESIVPKSAQQLFAEEVLPLPSTGTLKEATAAPELKHHEHLGDGVEVRVPEPQEIPAWAEAEVQAAEQSSRERGSAASVEPRAHERFWKPWFVTAAAGLALVAWAWWAAPGGSAEKPSLVEKDAGGADYADAGTVGLGDAAELASTVAPPEPSASEVMAEDALPEPLPGQTRPDGKGRCPHKGQVALNRGCWIELPFDRQECEGSGGYVFRKMCYLPIVLRERQPTSSPAKKP